MIFTIEPQSILFPSNQIQFRQIMKNLRTNLYYLVDVTADAILMAKDSIQVKVRFPHTEGI